MNIRLIDVQKNDWDFILDLRNQFFQFFYKQTTPITKDEHYLYLGKQEKNPNFHHWMITCDDEKVGYIRILNNDVGIMIRKDYQNKGIASQALALIEKEAKKFGIKKLIALIKVGNESSKNIFLKNKYEFKMYWLEKNI